MNKQEHSEKIIQLLEEIVSRTNLINRNPDGEICLEVDLIMEDVRQLYRHYSMLKQSCAELHDGHAGREVSEQKEVPSFFTEHEAASVAVMPDPPAENHEEIAAHSIEPEPASEPEPAPEPAPTPAPAPQAASPAQSDNDHGGNGKSVGDLFSGNPSRSIGDKLGGEDNSLHQRISSQKEDKSIGARLQQNPISSIKEAIGLNDKFLFINELFNGDIQAYNNAISQLNEMGSLGHAFDYLNNLTKEFGWDSGRSAETVEKLASFVQRRYLQA